jgi:membrane dipeptidase
MDADQDDPEPFAHLSHDVDLPGLAHFQTGEPYEVPLSPAEEDRVVEVIEENRVLSLHDHPFYVPDDIARDYEPYTAAGWTATAYGPLSSSPLDAVFASPFNVRNWDEAIDHWGKHMADFERHDGVAVCTSVEDLERAFDADRIGIVPCLETAEMIERDLDRLDTLYGLGIRSMNVSYTYVNQVATGYGEARDAGLSTFGRRAVSRMNELGILVDASHASDLAVLDVCEVSDDPVVLSHNGAQALLDIDRLHPDEPLRAVADTGGLIGVQAGPFYTASANHPRHSIHSYMDHFEYLVDLVGIDHVAFGPDTLYGDHVGLQRHFGLDLSEFPAFVDSDITHVEGMDNPTEAWNNIVRWLVGNDYSDDDIEKVLGGNVRRVLEQVW